MKKQRVSSAVIRRLPRYYRHLNDLFQAGTVRISSNALGKSMSLTASQIRQDLSCFGEFGQQGYGYNIEKLRGEISDILGMNRGHNAVIFGAGNLGRALIE
ncbi:MAG: winged-helix domain-containing protein, partial [Lawsonibacter sp.]